MADLTKVLHTDVAGTSYSGYTNDYRRLKAVRKFIVYHNPVGSNAANYKSIITALTANIDGSCTTNCTTLLGPRWADPDDSNNQQPDHTIVHPDNNELPLNTVDVVCIGEKNYLVTANYAAESGVAGGGSGVPTAMSMRSEVVAKRVYEAHDINGALKRWVPDDWPSNKPITQFGLVTTVIQLKIRIPFARGDNPLKNGKVLPFIGGLNKTAITDLGGVEFGIGYLRFDGISMDEFGSVTTTSEGTFRFKGFYEFTARADQFLENTPARVGDQWNTSIETRPTVNKDGLWQLSDLGL